jgi:hypothetical protein
MRKFAVIAALLAVAFLILVVQRGASRRRSAGLQVMIALAVPCRTDLLTGELVRALRRGLVRLTSESALLSRQPEAIIDSVADSPFADSVSLGGQDALVPQAWAGSVRSP